MFETLLLEILNKTQNRASPPGNSGNCVMAL